MTSTGFRSPWQGVWSLDVIVNRRIRRPRTTGVTMIIDTGLGATALRDILALAGDHIDHWKFGFGTSALMPLAILEEKLALLHARDVLTYPGGTLLEAAIVQQHCRVFMRHAKDLGFGAVEVSEGTIDLPGDRRRRVHRLRAGCWTTRHYRGWPQGSQAAADSRETGRAGIEGFGLGCLLGDHRRTGVRAGYRHLRPEGRNPH